MKAYLLVASAIGASAIRPSPEQLAIIVDTVNDSPTATWKASKGGRDYASLYGPLLMQSNYTRRTTNETVGAPPSGLRASAFPAAFDMRAAYPACQAIASVQDQGQCGGCWAFSVAASLSDRLCRRGVDVLLSAQNTLDCTEGRSIGCNGGFTEDGFDQAAGNGLLSASCVPWSGGDASCTDGQCVSKESPKAYTSSYYKYVKSDPAAIKAELAQHGSISAVFEVFEDFFTYSSGVYSHTTGNYAGLHAVNMLGYGTDQGNDYWIVKNSWGSDFGEGGFFRIAQATNGCNMEGGLTSAIPSV